MFFRQKQRATDERAIVVVELHKKASKRTSVLVTPADRVRLRPGDCDHLLFVGVRKDPLVHRIGLKPYYLDSGKIQVGFHIHYQLQDALQLWKACNALDKVLEGSGYKERRATLWKIPLGPRKKVLELNAAADMAIDQAMRTLLEERFDRYTRKFLQNTTIAYLINNTSDTIQSFQQLSTRSTAYQRLEDELTRESRKIAVDGITILSVDAEIDWSNFEHEVLTRQQAQMPTDNDALKKAIERQNQYTQRQHTNFLLDNDTTFAPYNLRHLIMALNPELLEKFYHAPSWDEAMQAVYAAIDKKKKERLEEKNNELAHLRKVIEDAQAVKMRDDELRRLQTLFVDTVIEQRTVRQSLQSASPQALLQELLGPAQNRLLTVNNVAEPADAEIVM